jgi:PAS domain S-box-containing protein
MAARLGRASALTIGSIGLLWWIHHLTSTTAVVGELIVPVAVAAYMWGAAAGIAATVLATAGAAALVLHADATDIQRIVVVAVNGGVITALTHCLHLARRRVDRTNERFASAFDACPLPYAMMRMRDRVFLGANEAFLRYFGYAREEVIGRDSNAIDFCGDDDELFARDGEVHDLEHAVRLRSGELRQIRTSVQLVELEHEPVYLGVWQDITEHKRSEDALRDSEARFRQLAETIHEVFWLFDDREQRLVYVSPGYESIWGRSIAAIAANPDDWALAIHPADRERVRTRSRMPGYDEEYRITRPDGAQRWIRDRAFPVRDEQGNVIRTAGLAEDITERRVLEEQLRQAQKMESLGMLAGGVAHDFNNLLAVISTSVGMLAESVPSHGEERELVEEIDAAVTRATGLTRQLLAFSRKQVAEPKVIDINGAVNETRKMLRRMVGEDVLLTTSLDPDLRSVRIDPGYLVQVLMNLAVNARDAMPRGGTLELSTRNTVLDDAFVRAHLGAQPGPAVMLSVTDTGCGMSAEILARIFEPFFTTKEQGRGTGMGLAVVHGIVDQAAGVIDVESTVGVGTTFRVYLPALEVQAERRREVSAAMSRGFETILFVDDDEYVRRAAGRALRARGYTVIEAADGAAALGQLHERIDLLLTDVVMPKMDGRELADAARAQNPGIRVLYTSGYTDDAIVRHGVLHGQVELIEKPFRMPALAARVRQVLDR